LCYYDDIPSSVICEMREEFEQSNLPFMVEPIQILRYILEVDPPVEHPNQIPNDNVYNETFNQAIGMKELKTKYGIHPPQKLTYVSKYPQLVKDIIAETFKKFQGKVKVVNKKEVLKGESFWTPPCLVSPIPEGTIYYEIILEKGPSKKLELEKELMVGKDYLFQTQSWSKGYWHQRIRLSQSKLYGKTHSSSYIRFGGWEINYNDYPSLSFLDLINTISHELAHCLLGDFNLKWAKLHDEDHKKLTHEVEEYL
ncbi:7835_t:CDS:2, partial [Funneliformis geosporum]